MQRPGDEIKHLQRCINDLVSILALPAIWSGCEGSRIANTLLDSLLRMLRLDFVYARLTGATAEAPIVVIRVADSRGSISAGSKLLDSLKQVLAVEPEKWSQSMPDPEGDGHIAILPLRMGLQAEIGVLVAGSRRQDFPRKTEKLILAVAANQASIGLHEAQLLAEQKRIATELDHRVERRTQELAKANEELRREIAERQQSEEALAKARAELAKVARVTSLGILTASIAHEINQPLSGIITNASTCFRMLSADQPNIEGARETARRTIRDGNRASDVITRLRTLYAKKDISPEPMNLNDATGEVISLSLDELQRNRVVLRTELAADLPPIHGDRIQLQQVILNLLRNASDAMSTINERPRELLIRSERDGEDHVRLTVKDVGVGFDPQDEGKLFEAFYTTKEDGMGIGLSLSRSIVEAHHGRLWAFANDGPGSTFAFAIPRNVAGAA